MEFSFFFFFLLFTLCFSSVSVHSTFIPYNTSSSVVPAKINVHLVPHSHDDVGWLKTVDQYYFGGNNSIRGACVQNVLDSVMSSLFEDKNRKFIYVEMVRSILPEMVAAAKQCNEGEGQGARQLWSTRIHVSTTSLHFLSFFFSPNYGNITPISSFCGVVVTINSSHRVSDVCLFDRNGGMCMHDEATPHYIDLIDQTTLGHKFIQDEFGQVPRVGWQIDPFGHSAVQAYLLGAEIGFDSLFFARIDYQDRAKRLKDKTLEVVWRGSQSLGSTSQIFTGIFPRHYDPPDGFTFEVNDVSPPIQDDVLLFDYNVQERVNDFVAAALAQANVTRTNHVMWLMGTDFRYQYANSWYRQMDKFIHYVNQDGRVNVLYSTPSMYTDAKHAADEEWPLKTGDFFPYADHPNAYWTGYFTSRPAFKGYVRTMSGYYLAARQLEFFGGMIGALSKTDVLADALAIAQHHDAVSGTQRQHVAADYALRISIGYKETEKLVASSLAFLMKSRSTTEHNNISTELEQALLTCPSTITHLFIYISFCPLLNISYCPPSESVLSDGQSLVVVAYNPLGWKREEVIRIPVTSEEVKVHDSNGKVIESQLLPLLNATLRVRTTYGKAYMGDFPSGTPNYWLAFLASLPPLGFNTYFVSAANHTGPSSTISQVHTSENSTRRTVEVGPGNLKLHFSVDEGRLTHVSNTRSLVATPVGQSYGYYTGNDGTTNDPQASGAYVFRPNETITIKHVDKIPLTIMKGPLLDEVHQQLSPWISQVVHCLKYSNALLSSALLFLMITRVYKGKDHAEIEFSIGPIPVEDGTGKEITTQIITSLKTNKTFYTDSNGRDFIKRIRDQRTDWELEVNQPVAGNYYPINLGIYVQDDSTELSVLVDRSVGGSSLVDGQIELMLHRRMIHDDVRGVGEVLNETVCVLNECEGLTVIGKIFLKVDNLGEGAKWRRTVGQELYSPVLVAFTKQEAKDNWMDSHIQSFSGIDPSYSLPNNVAIITLQELENGKVLIRLAHLYEVGEDKDYSGMARVELKKLFPNKKIRKAMELSLSANQERSEMEKRRLVWKVASSGESNVVVRGGVVDPVDLVVELAPMEIRTFHIDLEKSFHSQIYES
ncbi:Alpha-mannosidase At3g26720 [Linum perenne]